MQETLTCSVKAISLSTNLHIIELVCFTKFTKNGAHKNYWNCLISFQFQIKALAGIKTHRYNSVNK